MSQRMMIFRNTILVNQFEYIGEDGPEMLATMRDDFDRYTKEKDDELGEAEWTCDCRHF